MQNVRKERNRLLIWMKSWDFSNDSLNFPSPTVYISANVRQDSFATWLRLDAQIDGPTVQGKEKYFIGSESSSWLTGHRYDGSQTAADDLGPKHYN